MFIIKLQLLIYFKTNHNLCSTLHEILIPRIITDGESTSLKRVTRRHEKHQQRHESNAPTNSC